jgi:hypothetical protein
MSSTPFDLETFFPRRVMDAITEARVSRPDILQQSALQRKRRAQPTRNGRLNMLACDHPGRGVTGVLGSATRMGNRQQYMGRAVRALLHPSFDGVMAHTDLIEDLMILDVLLQEKGGPSLLNDRVVAGCMNRGGIHNVSGEIHDRFTSFSAKSLQRLKLDGGKMLIRAVDDDERTLFTVAECAENVTRLAKRDLLAFVEPLPMKGKLGAYTSNYSVPELVKWVGVCAALGETSRNTWLKIPYIDGFDEITLATTLPILVLGGPAQPDPMPTLREFASAMRSGNNVRGAMVGRNVLFPGDDDPYAISAAVGAVVHEAADADTAAQRIAGARGAQPDAISRYF